MGIDYQRESWEAWISHDQKQALRRVVKVLLDSGAGLTCDEVEVLTGMSHQTASATISHASRRGLLVKSGLRRPTRTGRKAQVYQLGTPPEANDGSNDNTTRTVETIKRPQEAGRQGQADHERQSQQGLDAASRPAPEADSKYRKAADLYRREGLRQDTDGGFDNCSPLFG